MISFLTGDIVDISLDSIQIDVNGIGFHVNVARPNDFSYGRSLVFTYFQVKEDSFSLFGFKTKKEIDLFNKLIEVSGIGPKTALGILGATTVDALIGAIEFGNIAFLKKLPAVGPKAASQIILDLKGKLVYEEKKENFKKTDKYQDVVDALRALGFKTAEIDNVYTKLEDANNMDIKDVIKECLKMLRK